MSLPSYAIFWKDEKPVAKTFINCGWWFSEDMIPGLLKDIYDRNGYPPEYDCVTMYQCLIDKSDIVNILKIRYNIDYNK